MKNLSRAERVLLSQFRNATSLEPSGVNGAWEKLLKKEPSITISEFIENGWIVEAPLEEQVMRLSTAEMKSRLKAIGEKISGTRAVLARKLADAKPDIFLSLPGKTQWRCSESIMPAVMDFLEKEASIVTIAKTEARQALDRGDLFEAARVAAEFDKQKVFSSINQDLFPSLDAGEIHHKLELICSIIEARPRAFMGIADDALKEAAGLAMWHALWAGGFSGIDKKLERVALNIGAWVSGKISLERDIKNTREYGIKISVTILGCEDCSVSLAKKGRLYQLGEVPEIPLSGCERLPCCGCCYSSVIKD